jgi:two-component sensor histidine kinase
VVIPYLALGAAWILFSDHLLISLVDDPQKLLFVSTAKGWLYVLVTALLLFMLVYGEMRKRAKLEAKLRKDLAEQDVMLSELNHRVMNNLQILISIFNLESENVRGDEAREMNDRARSRMHAMSLAQERLYESWDEFGKIELGSYLRALWSVLQETFSAKDAEAVFDLVEVRAGPAEAGPFGLFAAEAMSNAIRYGGAPDGPSRVEIRLARGAVDMIELSIRDRGPRLQEGAPGLGFRLMSVLAAQLRGRVERQAEGGTTVLLEFPLPEERDA